MSKLGWPLCAVMCLALVAGWQNGTFAADEKPKVAASTSAPAEETFKGTVESTKSQKRPRLVVGGTHYELKAAEKADASVKDTLAKISSGEATGPYVVKGTSTTADGKPTILVNSITKDAAAK